jgi:hypothetical protein
MKRIYCVAGAILLLLAAASLAWLRMSFPDQTDMRMWLDHPLWLLGMMFSGLCGMVLLWKGTSL